METTTPDGTHLNTVFATEVAHFCDGRRLSDPLHMSETLYRQKGAWFLVHRRGGRGGKEKIIPIMGDQACKWLTQKRFIGALAFHFGERVQRPRVNAL